MDPIETKVTELVINELSKEQYASITPNENEIYLVEDDFDPDDLSDLAYSGDYLDLKNTPTKLSDFQDDLGTSPEHTHSQYLTEHQDISGKADKATTLLGYGITDAYTKTEINNIVTSTYKAAGSVSSIDNLGELDANHVGYVYNVTSNFTTTSDFVEGPGKQYYAGANVVVLNIGTESNPNYKYDILGQFIDLSEYQLKNTAVTHIQNTSVGSNIQPVYINELGETVELDYTIEKSVPSNAKFTDTTYSDFIKSGSDSKSGLVPKPPTVEGNLKYLCEDGSWSTPQGTTYITTNSFTAGSTDILTSGGAYTNAVTKVEQGSSNNVLKVTKAGSTTDITINNVTNASVADKLGNSDIGDANTPVYLNGGVPTALSYTIAKSVPADAVFTDTTYSVMSGATSSSDGNSGLVPIPNAGDENKVLKGDGTWGTVSSTDTKNTAGATDTDGKIFLVGTTNQAEYGETYSHDTVFVDTSGQLNSVNPDVATNNTVVATTKWVKDQGYTNNIGTVTSVNSVLPTDGNVNIEIPDTSNCLQKTDIDNSTIKLTNDKLEAQGVIDSNTGNTIKSWSGTKQQYNAIQEKDPNTLYYVTDEVGIVIDSVLSSTSENPVQNKVINTALDGKQDTLVSGTNIKTINNESILDSGDISVLQNTATEVNALTILGTANNSSVQAINIGYNSSISNSPRSTAIGSNAKVQTANEAIQIGGGTNSTAYSLSVGFYGLSQNWQLLDGTTGLIPDARLSSGIARTSDVESKMSKSDIYFTSSSGTLHLGVSQ